MREVNIKSKLNWRAQVYLQLGINSCGVTCLNIVLQNMRMFPWIDIYTFFKWATEKQVNLLELYIMFQKLGMQCNWIYSSLTDLSQITNPSILYLNSNHFVVLMPKTKQDPSNSYVIVDPTNGIQIVSSKYLKKNWLQPQSKNKNTKGIILVINTA